MNEYLTFDKFITPVIIQILFWLGLAGMVIFGLLGIVNGMALQGLLTILIGPIIWRVYMETAARHVQNPRRAYTIRKQGEARP